MVKQMTYKLESEELVRGVGLEDVLVEAHLTQLSRLTRLQVCLHFGFYSRLGSGSDMDFDMNLSMCRLNIWKIRFGIE